MYEEPTVDERIEFLRRVKKASDQDLADVIEHPGRWNLPDWQMEIISDQRRRRLADKIEATAKRLAECTSRNSLDEAEQERLENRIREKILREHYQREKEEILKQINNKTTKTKTEKEDTTMAATKTTEATETAAQATPKFDVKTILGLKMAEMMAKAMDKNGTIPFTKMTIMQNLSEGKGINVTDIVKAKYTENFMKELDGNKDIPIGKLIAFQTMQEGTFDINTMMQAKFVEKLFGDLDEQTETEQKK
jgi:hypothetical protein